MRRGIVEAVREAARIRRFASWLAAGDLSVTDRRHRVALAGVGLLGVVVGFLAGTLRQVSLVAQLERGTVELRAERSQVNALAERLAEVEANFNTMRDVVLGGRPEVGRAPVSPPANTVAAGSGVGDSPEFAWPLAQPGFITQAFGSATSEDPEGHTGLDIAVPTGSYVRAIQAGRVVRAEEDPVYGHVVRIAHSGGMASLYGHNAWVFAREGEEVSRLQVIALSGSTGHSSAPHLHLEVSANGLLVDPLTVITTEIVNVSTIPEEGEAEPR